MDDATAFTRPWTAVLPLTHVNERLFEYACHEGNYALVGILRGASAGASDDQSLGRRAYVRLSDWPSEYARVDLHHPQ